MKFVIGFVCEPTKDQLYIIERDADFAMSRGIIKKVPKLTPRKMQKALGMWQVHITIPKEDQAYWFGVNNGKNLGINIGKTNEQERVTKMIAEIRQRATS